MPRYWQPSEIAALKVAQGGENGWQRVRIELTASAGSYICWRSTSTRYCERLLLDIQALG